jgi:hypothetical protein
VNGESFHPTPSAARRRLSTKAASADADITSESSRIPATSSPAAPHGSQSQTQT